MNPCAYRPSGNGYRQGSSLLIPVLRGLLCAFCACPYPRNTSAAVIQDNHTSLAWGVRAEHRLILSTRPSTETPWRSRFALTDASAGTAPIICEGNWTPVTDHSYVFEADLAPRQLSLYAECVLSQETAAITFQVINHGTRDRALHIQFDLLINAIGWTWWDDIRTGRTIQPDDRYQHVTPVPAGQEGIISRYPYACISGPDTAFCLGIPMDQPRLYQLFYDAHAQTFSIAFDLALTDQTTKSPNRASASFVLYASSPGHGFRGATQRYYDLYPSSFTNRVEHMGLWMPFTRINSVEDAQDFCFAFHEYGDVDLRYNNAHNIYSMRYLEPWTYWMKMSDQSPRTYSNAMEQLQAHTQDAAGPDEAPARATVISGMFDARQQYAMEFVQQPWCSGALFYDNSDPDIPTNASCPQNRADLCFEIAREEVVSSTPPLAPHWDAYGDGYRVITTNGRSGWSLMIDRRDSSAPAGAVQSVILDQTAPRPVLLGARVQTDRITGIPSDHFSLYADVFHTDSTVSWNHAQPINTGSHPGQAVYFVIQPEKPIHYVKLHLLMRGSHTGQAVFDDVIVADMDPEAVTALTNLLANSHPVSLDRWQHLPLTNRVCNAGFEQAMTSPRVDGIYLDSVEGWAKKLNYREAHFACVDVPLVYDLEKRNPVILNAFSIFEFIQAMSDYLHAHQRLLMGNWVVIDFPFYTPLLDIPGKEVHWLSHDGQFNPDSDAVMNYRRTLAYQKPYLLLLNVHFDSFTRKMMCQYFERSLFYGMLPSMFSYDAATDPYFEHPEWYNRDRPLFIHYMPIIRRVAQAGWEPLTHANTSTNALLIERFGNFEDGDLYYTVHADSPHAQRGQIQLDTARLEHPAIIYEWFSGQEFCVPRQQMVSIPVTLPGYGTRVYHVLKDDPTALFRALKTEIDSLVTILRKYREQRKIPAITADPLIGEIERALLDTEEDQPITDWLPSLQRALEKTKSWRDQQPHEELQHQCLRVQNSLFRVVRQALPIHCSIKGPTHLASQDAGTIELNITNEGSHAFVFQDLRAESSDSTLQTILPTPPPSQLPPGASQTEPVTVTATDRLDSSNRCPVTVSLTGHFANSDMMYSLPYTLFIAGIEPMQIDVAPQQIRTLESEYELQLQIRNNRHTPSTASITIETDDSIRPTDGLKVRPIEIPPTSILQTNIRIHLPAVKTNRQATLSLVLDTPHAPPLTRTVPIIQFPPTDNILYHEPVEIRVDSCFPGYSSAPLNDGITDTRLLSWDEACWASAENPVFHWVEIRFPAPQTIQKLNIFWAEDNGQPHISQTCRIEARHDGQWQTVAQIDSPNTQAVNRCLFQDLTTDRLRIVQPVGQGCPERPDLMWIKEIELYTKEEDLP